MMWRSNENWQDRIRSFDQIWWKPQATPVAGESGEDRERVLEINATERRICANPECADACGTDCQRFARSISSSARRLS